ncbi:MAG: hypothetical protein V1678_01065 [Candidatus Aenigmatarchaeota archaeon]
MVDRLTFIRNVGRNIADIDGCSGSKAAFGMFVRDYETLKTYIPVFAEAYQAKENSPRVMTKALYLSLLSNEDSHKEILKGYRDRLDMATKEYPFKGHNFSSLPFIPLDAKALNELECLVTEKKQAARYSMDVTDAKDHDILDFGYRTHISNDKLDWWASVNHRQMKNPEELSFLQKAIEKVNVAASWMNHLDGTCLHPVKL